MIFPDRDATKTPNMKHTIRITIAVLAIGLAAACADKKKEQPRPAAGGKTYVPTGK